MDEVSKLGYRSHPHRETLFPSLKMLIYYEIISVVLEGVVTVAM